MDEDERRRHGIDTLLTEEQQNLLVEIIARLQKLELNHDEVRCIVFLIGYFGGAVRVRKKHPEIVKEEKERIDRAFGEG